MVFNKWYLSCAGAVGIVRGGRGGSGRGRVGFGGVAQRSSSHNVNFGTRVGGLSGKLDKNIDFSRELRERKIQLPIQIEWVF